MLCLSSSPRIACACLAADRLHCFFIDPNVDWGAGVRIEDGVRTFDSTQHRKIRCADGAGWRAVLLLVLALVLPGVHVPSRQAGI